MRNSISLILLLLIISTFAHLKIKKPAGLIKDNNSSRSLTMSFYLTHSRY